jgi:hypothetical protein
LAAAPCRAAEKKKEKREMGSETQQQRQTKEKCTEQGRQRLSDNRTEFQSTTRSSGAHAQALGGKPASNPYVYTNISCVQGAKKRSAKGKKRGKEHGRGRSRVPMLANNSGFLLKTHRAVAERDATLLQDLSKSKQKPSQQRVITCVCTSTWHVRKHKHVHSRNQMVGHRNSGKRKRWRQRSLVLIP